MVSQDVPSMFEMLTNQPEQLVGFACGESANGKPGCLKSVPNVDQSAQTVFQFSSKCWPISSSSVPLLFQMLANQLKQCSNYALNHEIHENL